MIPTLRPGDIVVMDNLRTHHIQAVGELLHNAGIKLLYLPPYSPDSNPIEKLWSKVRSILRKLLVRTTGDLDVAIPFAFSQVSHDDCAGRFRSAGFAIGSDNYKKLAGVISRSPSEGVVLPKGRPKKAVIYNENEMKQLL